MSLFDDGLSTDLDTGPDSDMPSLNDSSSPPWRLENNEPAAFDLVGDYLISFFSVDCSDAPTQMLSLEMTEALELGSESSPHKLDQLVKTTRTSNGTLKRVPDLLKSKAKRLKLGFAFSEFLLENACQDKDDFLTTLGRDFVKKICFCVRAEKTSFDKVFKESAKLHSSGTKNVKVPASDLTKALYRRLFDLYLTIPDRKMLHSYERSISIIKKEKCYKSFNVAFQKYFYDPAVVRLFYRHYVEFLDGFGQGGERLKEELRLKRAKPVVAKEEMLYGYLQALGLRPVDKLVQREVFRLTLET